MQTITARSAWSWLRGGWLNPRRIRFWLAAVAILYTLTLEVENLALAEFERRPLPRAGPEGSIIRPVQTANGADRA